MLPYLVLDKAFFVFHTSLIAFNLFGWAWQKTRLANLIALLATAFSWCVLGLWKGIGYCPCTEWHWQVRARLGYHDMPASYLVFLIKTLTGEEANPETVDFAAASAVLTALTLSAILNARAFLRKQGPA